MAWKGPHMAPRTSTQARESKRLKKEAEAARRARIIAEGRCARCLNDRDRKDGTLCSACIQLAKAERVTDRESARRTIMEMERALGMPVLGVGGRGLK